MSSSAAQPPAGPPAGGDLQIRGLLHDLGHQMMTLSLLAETVRSDSTLSDSSRQRMELVMQEMFRIVDIIADCSLAAPPAPGGGTALMDIRQLAEEIAQLAEGAYQATVIVRPGGPAVLRVRPTLLWRVLANLVDNAVRAAGPDGQVEVSIEQGRDTVIEVTDNGPGFGSGPHGTSGLGMTVVRQLLEAEGGRLEVGAAPGGGTRVRVVFGLEREYQAVPMCAGTWH